MKLGTVQRKILIILSERSRGWVDHPYGPGWVWGTVSNTRKVLESLVKNGLVTKGEWLEEESGKKWPQYTLSKAGFDFVHGGPRGE